MTKPLPALPQPKPFELSKDLLDAWQRTVLQLARLPRNARKEMTPPQKMKIIVRQEMGEIHNLWEIFTQHRGELSRKLLSSQRLAVDYLLGFHLTNAARADMLLTRAEARTGFAQKLGSMKGRLILNDLGCGTGAISQILVHHLKRRGVTPERMTLHLFDGVGPLLDAARVLFQEAEPQLPVFTHRVRLEDLDTERLVKPGETKSIFIHLLGYIWNELAKNTGAKSRLTNLFETQAKRGDEAVIMLLEPATQDMSREAMRLRDQLVEAGYLPLFPCPAATPCPMMKLSRDWCYGEGNWRRPPSVVEIDEELGLDRSRLNGTMMLFVTPALANHIAADGKPDAIIVGRPDRTSGNGFDYLLCDGELKKAAPQPGKNVLPRGVSLTD